MVAAHENERDEEPGPVAFGCPCVQIGPFLGAWPQRNERRDPVALLICLTRAPVLLRTSR
jgi:hypothetical protein